MHDEDDDLGVLDDAGAVDTTSISVLGGSTAQVRVDLPPSDDDLDDDGVVDDDPYAELIMEGDPAGLVRDPDPIGRIRQGADVADIIIEVPSDEAAPVVEAERVADQSTEEPMEAAIVDERDADDAEPEEIAAEEFEAEEFEADEVEVQEVSTDAAAADDAETDHAGSEAGAADDIVVDEDVRHVPGVEDVRTEDEVADDIAPVTRPPRSRHEAATAAKRLGEVGERRESADLLTADRLLDPHQIAKPEPEGAWSHFVYRLSGRRINLGDSRAVRARKALSARISAPLNGGARFVPVLSRKGGVGKTTITTLLGMALADARDDRVIAVDANPDRGTLADRIARHNGKTVRDLVRIRDEVRGYHDISAVVSRDATRLDVLASDTDPRVSEAFSDVDYDQVAELAAHFYSLVLTDTGTGIVHDVMGATLDRADAIVVVAGLSVDEARLASETLTWLETNGHAENAREAVVVLNQSTPGAPLVRLDELEAHFATRVRHVVRMPYDPHIAAGSVVDYNGLQSETRQAARELAALVVENLRVQIR
ncbi:hypothetical protein GCM10025768_20030 [Microbacterium pseudoresistens]